MTRLASVTAAPAKPVLIFDGDCGFCQRWIARGRELTGDRIAYVPFQDANVAAQFPEIPPAQFPRAVVLIDIDGSAYAGAEAVFRTVAGTRGWGWLPGAYARGPGVARVTEAVYQFIARHRPFFSALTPQPAAFAATRWWFLRLVGLIYFIAFLSLWQQVGGLLGSHGIQPAAELMTAARRYFGGVNFWQWPTVCWFNTSDGFLRALCGTGTLLALLVIVDVATLPALAGLWLLYLSLCTVGDVFLGYQWDALLVETGLLAALFAPGSRTLLWLLRWLLFRLMFSAGVVKLASGDALWRSLKTLTIHYETQPLPTWIGWWAHQLPEWWQRFSCGGMFVIELAAPCLIFAPRRWRFAGAGAIVGLMGLIALTGNYCFFNLLTVALCFLLLDDEALPAWSRRLARWRPAAPIGWRGILVPVAIFLLVLSIPPLVGAFRARVTWPRWMTVGAAWRSVNGYGLFASMTNPRYEIVIEGSADGEHWRAYEFRDKPGDLHHRPGFVAPHQPRVDWQMWFAALGRYQNNSWLLNFCGRLLQGEPAVVRLLAENPFPEHPPRLIRAQLYEYHWTDPATRRTTGAWWRRELKGEYCPVLSLRPTNPSASQAP